MHRTIVRAALTLAAPLVLAAGPATAALATPADPAVHAIALTGNPAHGAICEEDNLYQCLYAVNGAVLASSTTQGDGFYPWSGQNNHIIDVGSKSNCVKWTSPNYSIHGCAVNQTTEEYTFPYDAGYYQIKNVYTGGCITAHGDGADVTNGGCSGPATWWQF